MFDIQIHGKIQHKRYIKKYAKDILFHFFKNRIRRNIPIKIKICDFLDGDQGQCLGTRNYVEIELATSIRGKRSRKRRPTLDQMLETLAHELIHAKQFLRGEINQRNLIWRGRQGPYDCRRLTYRRTPWEREAYNQEKELKVTYWDKQYKQLIK
jgi:hypothetical protein